MQLARRENANPGVRCERKRQAVNIARKNAEAKGRAPGRKRGPQDGAARAHATRECPRHFSKLHRRRPRGFRLRQTDGIAFRSIGPSAPGRHRSPRHEGSRHGTRERMLREIDDALRTMSSEKPLLLLRAPVESLASGRRVSHSRECSTVLMIRPTVTSTRWSGWAHSSFDGFSLPAFCSHRATNLIESPPL